MSKSAHALVQGEERAMMTIPSKLLDDSPSLRTTDIVRAKLKAALEEEKKKYTKVPHRLIRKYEAHIQKMLRLDAEIAKLNKAYERHRTKILEVWAMKGLSEIGGATVVPQTSLQIAHLETLARLPREMRKKVRVIVLDPAKFLRLAEEIGIPADILDKCVTVKVARVNVTLPKKKRTKSTADQSASTDTSHAEVSKHEAESVAPAIASNTES